MQEVVEELNVDYSTVTWYLKQIGKVKKLSRGCLMSWQQIKNIVILKCQLLSLYATMNHFSIRLWRVTKNGFYMTTSYDQLSDWTEKKFQSTSPSQTCIKKGSWSLFGGLLPVWSTTAFRIPAKPLHLRSMLSKALRCTKNYNTCSQNWSRERAQFFSQPHMAQTNASTVELIELWSFASSTIFTWPLDNWSSFLQASQKLAAGKTLPNQEEAENAFQDS